VDSPRSPDLTPLDFFLLDALRSAVYSSKPRTLQDLRRETEIACAAGPLATIQNVCQPVARRCQCVTAGGGHLNICDFKCENITILCLYVNYEYSKYVYVVGHSV
jgi:hypothetical protein